MCIDFHLGEMSQQCLYVMKVTLTCFFPRKTVNEMAGVGSRSNIAPICFAATAVFFFVCLFYQHKPLHLLFRVIFTLSTVVKTLKIVRTVKYNEYLKNPHFEEKLTF